MEELKKEFDEWYDNLWNETACGLHYRSDVKYAWNQALDRAEQKLKQEGQRGPDEFSLRKALKMQLPVFRSSKYERWFDKETRGKIGHHQLGVENNSYLKVPLNTATEHMARHEHPDKYFDQDHIVSLKYLMRYVKYLEEK